MVPLLRDAEEVSRLFHWTKPAWVAREGAEEVVMVDAQIC